MSHRVDEARAKHHDAALAYAAVASAPKLDARALHAAEMALDAAALELAASVLREGDTTRVLAMAAEGAAAAVREADLRTEILRLRKLAGAQATIQMKGPVQK